MDNTYDSRGYAMLPAQLNVSGVCFVLKAREVIIACLLAVAQETISDIAKGPSLLRFLFSHHMLEDTLNGIRFEELLRMLV